MRLINANRAISRVDEIPVLTDKNQAFFEGCRYMKKRVLKVLRTARTIDAVPVVRCKDCKYWQDNNGGYPHDGCRWGKGETPDPDDFCSYGERNVIE